MWDMLVFFVMQSIIQKIYQHDISLSPHCGNIGISPTCSPPSNMKLPRESHQTPWGGTIEIGHKNTHLIAINVTLLTALPGHGSAFQHLLHQQCGGGGGRDVAQSLFGM